MKLLGSKGSTIKNHWHLIVLGIFFMLMLYLHTFIYLYGDDYIYGSYWKGNWQQFFNQHIYHYLFKNGRALVHFVVTVVLIFDRYLWMFLNPITLAILIVLMAKILAGSLKQYQLGVFMGVLLVSTMGINISRETLFWLDGSFNYLYPMVLFLLNMYLTKQTIEDRRMYWYLPIIGFLSGATVEQMGIMSVGMLFLFIIDYRMIRKQNIKSIIYIQFITTVIGYLTVVLAPGNRIRMESGKVGIFDNIVHLSRYNFMGDGMNNIILLLMVSILLWLMYFNKKRYNEKFNKLILIIMGINIIGYGILSCFTKYITILTEKILGKDIFVTNSLWELTSRLDGSNWIGVIVWLIVCISSLITILSLIYVGIILYKKERNNIVLITSILGIGAQGMMLISPIVAFRTIFATVVMWFLIIIYSVINREEYWVLPIVSLISFAIFPQIKFLIIGITIGALYMVLYKRKRQKEMYALAIGILGIIAIGGLVRGINGYSKNAIVHQYNEGVIRQYKRNQNGGILYLKKAANEDYRYTMIYESEPHVNAFKTYYDLPTDVEIYWE